MAFRLVLLLGRWCRKHHRPFPAGIGRLLLVHGLVPAVALIVGVSLCDTLSLLGLLSIVFPALEIGLGGSLLRPFGFWSWLPRPWLRPISYLAFYGPLLATVVLFWLCGEREPSAVRRNVVQALAGAILVLVIPLADLVGIALCVASAAVLVWANAPSIFGRGVAAARWFGFIKGGEK